MLASRHWILEINFYNLKVVRYLDLQSGEVVKVARARGVL